MIPFLLKCIAVLYLYTQCARGNKPMTNEEEYLVETVVRQLRYLRKEWTPNIDLGTTITNSNVLRVLLVERNLDKCWRICGYTYPLRIKTITLSSILEQCTMDKIIFAFTGGANHKGTQWALGIMTLTENHPRSNSSLGDPPEEEINFHQYISMPCMIIHGEVISVEELIKYAANKLGGTHIDFHRQEHKALEKKFSLIDSLHNFRGVDKNIIALQLLSIGQSLVNSKHIQRLMKRNV
jgi:hypothetical protein